MRSAISATTTMTNNPVAQPAGVVEADLCQHVRRVLLYCSHFGDSVCICGDDQSEGTHDDECEDAQRLWNRVAAPTPDSIAEKAERVTRRIINALPYEVAQHVNRQLLMTIITTEFGVDGE